MYVNLIALIDKKTVTIQFNTGENVFLVDENGKECNNINSIENYPQNLIGLEKRREFESVFIIKLNGFSV